MMTSKEDFLDYMVNGTIHLGKKDFSFFYNLKRMMEERNFITSAQSNLYDKLIYKYSRQLRKYGYEPKEVVALPWNTNCRETTEQYTNAFVSIVNNTLVIRSPFNKKFLNDLRKKAYHLFTWDKETKTHKAEFTTHAFKLAIELTNQHYTVTKYDQTVQQLLDDIEQYKESIWNPTLVERNGNYFVVACNSTLYKVLPENLNNDNKTILELTNLGITIDKNIVDDDEKEFFSTKVSKVNFLDLDTSLTYLKNVGITKVVLAKIFPSWKTYVSRTLKSLNIEYIDIEKNIPPLDYENYVLITSRHNFNADFSIWENSIVKVPPSVKKVILVINLEPIRAA